MILLAFGQLKVKTADCPFLRTQGGVGLLEALLMLTPVSLHAPPSGATLVILKVAPNAIKVTLSTLPWLTVALPTRTGRRVVILPVIVK